MEEDDEESGEEEEGGGELLPTFLQHGKMAPNYPYNQLTDKELNLAEKKPFKTMLSEYFFF
jgi:hypothetical protein